MSVGRREEESEEKEEEGDRRCESGLQYVLWSLQHRGKERGCFACNGFDVPYMRRPAFESTSRPCHASSLTDRGSHAALLFVMPCTNLESNLGRTSDDTRRARRHSFLTAHTHEVLRSRDLRSCLPTRYRLIGCGDAGHLLRCDNPRCFARRSLLFHYDTKYEKPISLMVC